jgi:hypothetical protein
MDIYPSKANTHRHISEMALIIHTGMEIGSPTTRLIRQYRHLVEKSNEIAKCRADEQLLGITEFDW